MCQESICHHNPVEIKAVSKFWKIEQLSFLQIFFFKTTKFEIPNFYGIQNIDRGLLYLKNSNIPR